MKNIKSRIALLGILAIIGIGMVLAAYFIGILDYKEKAVNQTEGADKGIAIILKPAQETGTKETNASVQEETYETASEKLKSDLNEAPGRAEVMEEKTMAATGAAEAGEAESRGDGGGGENYTVASGPVPVQTLQMPNTSSSSENLQQNITNSLNIVVVQKGQVMSNETVNLEDE